MYNTESKQNITKPNRTEHKPSGSGDSVVGMETSELGQMALQSQRTQKVAAIQAMAKPREVTPPAPMPNSAPVVQAKLYYAQGYDTSNAANVKEAQEIDFSLKMLDALAQAAEKKAKQIATDDKAQKSNNQVNFARQKDAKSWGYCVEEILNYNAAKAGWDTQVVLPKSSDSYKTSRPDYGRKVNNTVVLADLTSPGQSGAGGPHVLGKILEADVSGLGSIVAADVTYPSFGGVKVKLSAQDLLKIQQKNLARAKKKNDEYVPDEDEDDDDEDMF